MYIFLVGLLLGAGMVHATASEAVVGEAPDVFVRPQPPATANALKLIENKDAFGALMIYRSLAPNDTGAQRRILKMMAAKLKATDFDDDDDLTLFAKYVAKWNEQNAPRLIELPNIWKQTLHKYDKSIAKQYGLQFTKPKEQTAATTATAATK